MTKRLQPDQKRIRKPISRACVFCHEKHLQCDVGRPCQNCLKRNIGGMCTDKLRKKRRRDAKMDIRASESPASSESPRGDGKRSALMRSGSEPEISSLRNPVENSDGYGSELGRELGNSENSSLSGFFEAAPTPVVNSGSDGAPNRPANKVLPSDANFDSIWANDEYVKLNDILNESRLSDTESTAYKGKSDLTPVVDKLWPDSGTLFDDPTFSDKSKGSPMSKFRAHISLETQPYPGANNSACNSPTPELSGKELLPIEFRQLIKTPKDLYDKKSLVRPHNYRGAYENLLAYLKARYSEREKRESKSLQIIANSMAIFYSPIFVTMTTNLIESDLELQEFVLQRTLLEYESMANLSNCTPMCIWRRSCELCFVSNEFLSMTGFSREEVLAKNRFIIEFMDDESVVRYFRIFNENLAFGAKDDKENTCDSQAVFSECNLLLKNQNFLRCASVWTVKRDHFNIPLLVMGQFLPIH
ncbi:LAMI_0H07514g1_1 [Lachancea mirantina]|uniref:Glucose starvation modulator protein 1 n=1 Tax=Lachancea mirantina TaxID=1230905 RepID=A0A1G4KFL0_9SACH|nr:LAMI_0H07514g1_1 [Lachancea mirantina]